MERTLDIQPLPAEQIPLSINGTAVTAAPGETVLSVLNAVGVRQLALNDHGQVSGAFCGMGVCHCCLVAIDGQTLVRAGMRVETQVNPIVGEARV